MPREAAIHDDGERCVFLSCPYDDDYQPLFNAAVFTIVCCGLIPVCALTINNPSQSRLNKIIKLISRAKYSIHDLCRCHGQSQQNFARLNMPLELGISISLSYARERQAEDGLADNNNWHLLVPDTIDEYAYQRFVSDLQGSDPIRYSETPETVIITIMSIIRVGYDLPLPHTPRDILGSLPFYERELEQHSANWLGRSIPWPNVVELAIQVAQTNDLIPVGKRQGRSRPHRAG